MRLLWQKIKTIDEFGFRFFTFLSALFIYGLLGAPTPDNPGPVEVFIAMGLFLSVGLCGFYRALQPRIDLPIWDSGGRLLLVYGLSLPLIMGVFSGHHYGLMFRDIAPFLFLLLPIFLSRLLDLNPIYKRYYLNAVIFIGVLFSSR